MESFVELLCVGNELLIGKITNTNAQWLAKRITTLGMKVKRITVVGDDIDEISTALKEVMERKPTFVITTGGLGPTFDDKTLEGVAKALNCELEKNEEALMMVEKKYRRYMAEGRIEHYELTPHRVKMAMIPKGSKPIRNPVGTAPGVLAEREGVKLVMLPGVPSEMKAIFDESVAPLIRQVAGNLTFYEASIEVWGVPESSLAPLIDQVMHDNPYVYVKSHPKAAEKIPHLELHLSTTSEDADLARQRVSKALVQISEMANKKGGKIKPIKS
ncbi:MAG: nicotinamide mononucleotide deamidase-related protein [Candidatus Bathyarchaeia archaeon]